MNRTVGIILLLLALAFGWQLGSVPGLMGDEGSEGENVYELLSREGVTVTGERSYIGPLIDYVRVPFMAWLGYTPLALRLPMWMAAMASGVLLWIVLRKLFGEVPALFAAGGVLFSPIFLLTGRLGWTITLFPLFTILLVWMAGLRGNYVWVWWGLLAGIALANHILFLPTLVGVIVGGAVYLFLRQHLYGRAGWRQLRSSWRQVVAMVGVVVVGFWAGFGMQFVVLQLLPEDQGDPTEVAVSVTERWQDVPAAAPLYLSGSSYMAHYTGVELRSSTQTIISVVLVVLSGLGCWLWRRNPAWWAFVVGLVVQLVVLLVMIDRFTLRYFMMPTLGVWLLAWLAVGAVIERLPTRLVVKNMLAVVVGLALIVWMIVAVLLPFNRTGGSVNDFSLGNRMNSADALVDHRPLVTCLRGQGAVWSENVHIWNRLQYVSHQYSDLVVVPETKKSLADWIVHYRKDGAPGGTTPGDLCPELAHFRVVKR